MKIKATKKMGEVHVQFEFEGDLRQSLHKAAFLFDRDYCPLDGFRDSDIWYDVREQDTEKGKFIFVNRKCKAVDGRIASSKLGERKDDKGYFWHEWEVYTPTAAPAPSDDADDKPPF